MDPNSFANTEQVVTLHSHFDWTVDFDKSKILGSVEHTLNAIIETDRVVLDTSFINIKMITDSQKRPLKYELAPRHSKFGSALTVFVDLVPGTPERITLEYETTDKCTAVQWLTPAQTVGKKHPYLFTQCQAIHARSIFPCQDTPAVKITYSAQVTVPDGLTALMSALPLSFVGNVFSFDQPVKIPSYLVALAVGNLKGIKVGPRSTVWSEPEVVEAAAWEFADTESFISTGESILTPYVWGVYDLLLLPASFPYGGMENPCLTFVTPSLLAGDRSLVDVVAHEIAHSWMGNLVTTKNWEHFWLNEGFTMFIERKIIGRLHGNASLHFSAIIGYSSLKETIERYNSMGRPEFTCLCPKLVNEDPDDAFSDVPYEKGYNFLFYLETLLGGPSVFEPYLKAHVENFAHKSITTDDFKEFLFEFYQKFDASKISLLSSVDWNTWLYTPGLPNNVNQFDDTLAKVCVNLSNRWISDPTQDFVADEFLAFSSTQKAMFLEKMSIKPISVETIKRMDQVYNVSAMQNSEICLVWQLLCLQNGYTEIYPQVQKFLVTTGRMKYVRPIYRALFKVNPDLARKIFEDNFSFYHPICSGMVSKDLKL